jgi:hypothetical protein
MYTKQVKLAYNELKFMNDADKYRRNETRIVYVLTILKPFSELLFMVNKHIFDTKEYNVYKHYNTIKKAAKNKRFYDYCMGVWENEIPPKRTLV